MDVLEILNKINENYKANISIGNTQQIINFNTSIASQSLNLMGLAASETGDLEKAIFCFETATKLQPEYHVPWSNLSHIHHKMKKYEDAYNCILQSLKISNYTECQSLINAAVILISLERYDEARVMYEKALLLDPEHFELQLYYSNLLLRQGYFEKGFEIYENRYKSFTAEVARQCRDRFTVPTWDGLEAKDKTVLLYNEQGIGDFIMFARFLPEVKKKVGRLICEVQESLKHILYNFSCVDDWVLRPDEGFHEPAPSDLCASICSLPHLLKIRDSSRLECEPYIKPCLRFSKPINSQKKKVGLCWYGNGKNTRDHFRSIPLSYYKLLLECPNVEFYGLNWKTGGKRIWHGKEIDLNESFDDFPFVDLGQHIKNFGDLSYYLSELDLVISVDTAIVHMAGAMGVPCWVILNENIDWRWFCNRETTPWYQSVKIFSGDNSWESVLLNVKKQLFKFFA